MSYVIAAFGILFAVALLLAVLVVLAYVLAQQGLFFRFMKEGTVVYVVKGPPLTGTFSHCIMAWRGHYLNDPRRWYYDSTLPAWEVRACEPEDTPSAYSPLSPWRLFEHFGIYWYGLSPFYNIHQWKFVWSEPKIGRDNDVYEPWFREEHTEINYVSDFVYWVHLDEAEDRDNVPVNLDYLLTTAINNPYKARFSVTSWLTRLTADTNNAAKVWVGQSTFEDIVKEVRAATSTGNAESGFVTMLREINTDLPTDHTSIGAPLNFGVTVKASSLQRVEIAGRGEQQAEIQRATTAKLVATRQAEATVATAEGDKKARILRAEGDQQAIELVYRKVQEFGATGMMLSQLDAMAKANAAGGTIVWANNPFIGASGLADILQRANLSPEDVADFIKSKRGSTSTATP